MSFFRKKEPVLLPQVEVEFPLYCPPPPPRPEPWRDATYESPLYVVPVGFAQTFADRARINEIARSEEGYVADLRASIEVEGLKVPPVMKFDPAGKLRYHDGYHRLTAILGLEDFTRLPVLVEPSPNVKGYGRPLAEEVIKLFALYDDPTRRNL